MNFNPGIYFGLDEAEYHAVPALGSSGIKDLLVSPLTYWIKSPFNPCREDKSSEAKEKGAAFHKRLLEGPDVFERHYAVKPVKEDFPEALDGARALQERCAELGLKKSGKIEELCARIKEADPDAVLWPEVMAQFEAESEGKTVITLKTMVEIERHARIVEVHEGAMNAFRGGYPEVSIFWTDAMGIPCKARVDYLKVRTAVDLKSFSNPLDFPIDEAVGRAMASRKYGIQGYHYMEGIEAVKAMYRQNGESAVHGEPPPKDWLDAFSAPGDHRFFFLFLETGEVPNARIREFRASAGKGAERNAYWIAEETRVDAAKQLYLLCMDEYGPDKPWVDPQAARPFEDSDFPLYAFG